MQSITTRASRVRGHRHAYLAAASLLALSPVAAYAQDVSDEPAPVTADADQPAPGEIVVTGSRAAITGFSAPSAVSVVSGQQIQQQVSTTVAEVLQIEPAFKGTRSPGGNGNNFSTPGQSTADLRGLGGQRTLVLVDGSRVVPQAPAVTTGVPVTTDLNVIPTNMIDRVEVVTGGASAQYGSDAVAGVVNILLRKKVQGIELSGSTAISGQGDNFRYNLGAVGGLSFAEDRGHVVLSGEMTKFSEIDDLYSRDWGAEEYMIVNNANFATNGMPAQIVGPHVKNANSVGGRISGPANFSLLNYTFNDDGTIRKLDVGTLSDGTYQLGGEGLSRNGGSSLVPGVKRKVVFGRADYQFSDAATLILEGGYAQTDSFFNGGLSNSTGAGYTVSIQNPFLPQAVKTAMTAQGLTTINVQKGMYDVGNINFYIKNKTPHGMIGLEGKFGNGWSYDTHYSYGENHFRADFTNNFVPAFVALAVDVISSPTTGQPICRASLTPNPLAVGCIPINIFGPTAATTKTPTASSYTHRSDFNDVVYKQHSAGINLRGSPFSTWAGPISVALGGEYRKESQVLTAGPLATIGRFAIGNAIPFTGKFDVKEGYVEAIVPLAKDMAFAKSLDINGAIRYADYSSAGGQTTWKVGGVYEPVDGVRFRATRSRDIRAPAIYELFSPGSAVATLLSVRGASAVVPQNRTIGNPNLRPEKADTLTLGLVLAPTGVPGLRMSLDYFDIKIRDAIDSASVQDIGAFCTAGNALYCSFITFAADNKTPTAVNAPVQNLSQFRNRGIDGALQYRLPVGAASSLTTRFAGTYMFEATVNGVDHVNENGAGAINSAPRFRGNLTETLASGPWTVSLQGNYISKGLLSTQFNTAPSNTINDNTVDAALYVNLFSSVKVTDAMEFNFSVFNLFDKDPPVSPYATQGQAVNGIYYDKIGRVFQVGAKLKI